MGVLKTKNLLKISRWKMLRITPILSFPRKQGKVLFLKVFYIRAFIMINDWFLRGFKVEWLYFIARGGL